MKSNPGKLNHATTRVARRVLRWYFLTLLAVVAFSGCKPEAKAPPETKTVAAATVNPVGNYSLATVDGHAVPCTVQHEGHTMTIKSGSFNINADGTCSSKMSLEGRDAPIEVNADFTQAGSKLTMKWHGAGMTVGTLEDDTFTMNNEGMVFAYRK
jgi:hypothetical protein